VETTDLSRLEAWFTPVLLTLPRVTAIFLVFPVFSGRIFTGFARSGLLLIVAIFLSPLAQGTLPQEPLGWVLLIGKEALIGVLLGLSFGVFLWVLESVGDLIDFQTGSANASFFDPVSEHEGGVTGAFLIQLGMTLFFAAGGMLVMLGSLVESYELWPVNAWLPDLPALLRSFAIRQGDTLFEWIVKLAAPVVLVLLLVELGLGLVNRFTPQLDVFGVAQPLKQLLAILMMVLFLYLVYDALASFLRPDTGLLQLLRSELKPEPMR
jgi:type III secretion protein T